MLPMRLNLMGGVDISLPNVSYCEDVKDIHYTPYNLVRFYVGEITGTTPQTVKIYTDANTSIPIQVSEGNKWYTYVLPKYKGLYRIESGIYDDGEWHNSIVTKAVVKADISYYTELIASETYNGIIPPSTVEASFKGSNTSNVTNMNFMFNGCSGLTSLDLSSFDTSNVTDMILTFFSCSSLESLNVSSFNTSNVIRMTNMFSGCSGLTSLDVSNFDTSKVTDMNSMFNYCHSLKSLDLSNFNTSNVTSMNSMFNECSGLTSLDLSSFDTSKVTDMSYMFNSCNGLISLDLSNFDTSNVTTMVGMFEGCTNLRSLDLSNFDTSNVTNTTSMFNGCTKLSTITMKGCLEDTRTKIKSVMPSGATIVP